jgi:hypothetical protein
MNFFKNIYRHIKIINGWLRLNLWHVCPYCNHDAPLLYDCPVCEYYKNLPRYMDDQTQNHKRKTWNKFIELIK